LDARPALHPGPHFRSGAGLFGTHDLSYLAFAGVLQINVRQHKLR
jgi:hypothetical protein